MSDSLAVVGLVGVILGSIAITVLGLVALARNKPMRFRGRRDGIDLSVNEPRPLRLPFRAPGLPRTS